jgi:hypothetical protein
MIQWIWSREFNFIRSIMVLPPQGWPPFHLGCQPCALLWAFVIEMSATQSILTLLKLEPSSKTLPLSTTKVMAELEDSERHWYKECHGTEHVRDMVRNINEPWP